MFRFEPIKIANISDSGDIQLDFKRFISLYEKKCLVEVLGECLYKDIQDSYTFADGVFTLKDTATDAIKHLVNGFDYEAPINNCVITLDFDFYFPIFSIGCGCGCGSSNCISRKWRGFIQKEQYLAGTALADYEHSFIADYIYYHYMLVNRTATTGTGQTALGSENGQTVVNTSKRIDRYNEFIFQVIGRKNETSLYRFLMDNKADYPTWSPNCNLTFKDKF